MPNRPHILKLDKNFAPMSYKVYTKAPAKVIDFNNTENKPPKVVIVAEPKIKQRITVWQLLVGVINDIKELVTTSTTAGFLLPAIFILAGGFLLWQEIGPSIDQNL